MSTAPADLDPELRSRLEKAVARHPALQEKVDELLAVHAAGDATKRIEIEFLLERLVTPDRRALWIGGGTVLAVVVIVAVLLGLERRQTAAVARGTPTVAKVLRTEPGDCLAAPKKAVCLRLELELHPTGKPTYTGSLTEPIGVEWTSRVQPGAWLTVSVDPDDRNDILFDPRTMTVAAPTPPASE